MSNIDELKKEQMALEEKMKNLKKKILEEEGVTYYVRDRDIRDPDFYVTDIDYYLEDAYSPEELDSLVKVSVKIIDFDAKDKKAIAATRKELEDDDE